ncbi:unnamed protein product [Ectocarpus sp. 4 AP-2014]
MLSFSSQEPRIRSAGGAKVCPPLTMSPVNKHPCTRSSSATHRSPPRKFSWLSDPGCAAKSFKDSSCRSDQKFAPRVASMGILVKTASDKSRRVSTRTFIDISSLIFMLLSGSV